MRPKKRPKIAYSPVPQYYWREMGVSMPETFTATFTDKDLPGVVELEARIEHARYVCTKLTCTRHDGGQAITGPELRKIPVGRLLQQAAQEVFSKVRTVDTEEQATQFLLSPMGASDGEALASKMFHPGRSGDGGTRAELRKQVVELYRKALATGDRSPRKSVAEAVHKSESYVARLLWEARRDGDLGPAQPGKAGEIKPKKRTRRRS